MDLKLNRQTRGGFTLIDSLIGLTIISIFSILYISMTTQMDHRIDDSQQIMMTERHHYETAARQK